MKNFDGYDENDIFTEIVDEALDGGIGEITEDDIIKMILVEHYLYGIPAEEIMAEWELTPEEFKIILEENKVSYEMLEKWKKELFGEE